MEHVQICNGSRIVNPPDTLDAADLIGARIVYHDYGLPFGWPPQDREAEVIGIDERGRLVVSTPALNVPQRIDRDDVRGFIWQDTLDARSRNARWQSRFGSSHYPADPALWPVADALLDEDIRAEDARRAQ